MCQLLGMNANTPTDVMFSFTGLATRADEHKDGFGIAFFEDKGLRHFVDHYGARVLSEPPAAGLNWLVYVVPPVAFCAGIFLLFMAFRTWKRTGSGSAAALASDPSTPEKDPGSANSPGAAASSAADDEYAARFEEQLRKSR